MSGNELARRTGAYGSSSLEERKNFAQALAQAAELLPQNYWTKPMPNPEGGMFPARPSPGKVLFMTETASMLGIHPMAGLTSIHIIEGKPTLSAGLWASLAREAGHRVRVWVEGQGEQIKAIATVVRSDDPEFEFRVEWTYADARTASLLGKDNWKKYLRSMLKSRALTEVIREACPEVGMGAAYTAEELNPNIAVTADGVPVEMQVIPDASQGGTPEPQQRPEPEQKIQHNPEVQKDVVDEQTGETEDSTPDYTEALNKLTTSQEARDLYQAAGRAGHLGIEIKYGRYNPAPLSEIIQKIGEKLVKIEEEQARARAEMEASQAEGDDEVVHATIDDDDEPMALGGQQ